MLFVVSPVAAMGRKTKWEACRKILEEKLEEPVNLAFPVSFDEMLRLVEAKEVDLACVSFLEASNLIKMGYLPLGVFKEPQRILPVRVKEVSDTEKVFFAVPMPLFSSMGLLYTFLGRYLERINIIPTRNFLSVVELLNSGKVQFGLLSEDYVGYVKGGVSICEELSFNFEIILVVRSALYNVVRDVVASLEGFEEAHEDIINGAIGKFLIEWQELLRLWSAEGILKAMDRVRGLGILLYNSYGIRFVNRGFSLLTGYKSEEMVGMSVYDFIDMILHPNIRSFAKSVATRRMKGEHFALSYSTQPIKRKDGSFIYCFIVSETVMYEDSYGGMVFFIDSTKLGRLERAYRLLKSVNEAIISSVTKIDLFNRIAVSLVDDMGLRFVWVGACKEYAIEPIAKYGYEEGFLDVIHLTLEGSCLLETTFRTNSISIVSDLVTYNFSCINEAKCLKEMSKRGYRSLCIIPILEDNKIAYLLCLYSGEPNFFVDEMLEVLQEVKRDVEFGLKRIREIENGVIIERALVGSGSYVVVTDEKGKIVFANSNIEYLLKKPIYEILGTSVDFFAEAAGIDVSYKAFYKALLRVAKEGKEVKAIFPVRDKTGSIRYLDAVIYPVLLPDSTRRILIVGRDITKEVFLSREVERLTFYDFTTGLLNIHGFRSKVVDSLYSEAPCAIVLIDLWNFAFINDVFGREVGDKALTQFASLLKKIFEGKGIVARIFGDKFLVWMYGIERDDVIFYIRLLEDELKEPFIINGDRVYLSFNAGVAFYPEDGKDIDVLYNKVKETVRRAKSFGEGEICFCSDTKESKRVTPFAYEIVRKAVDKKLFTFYYQPFYKLFPFRLAGFEALVRVVDENGQVYAPGAFIDYLEQSRYLRDFESWAISEIKSTIDRWKLPISINISARTFKDKDFLVYILEELKDYPVIVEITERVLLEDYEAAKKFMEDTKRTSMKVALDDFGIGYSSLNYIANFQVDVLKIDVEFVRDMLVNSVKKAIVKNLVSLGNEIGIEVHAEGVETYEQLEFLKNVGCTHVQGFLFAKPMPKEEAEKLIIKGS